MEKKAHRVQHLYDFIPAEADLKLGGLESLNSEKVHLFAHDNSEVRVKRLKYSQIPRALRTYESTGPETDPVASYIEDTPDAEKTRLTEFITTLRTTMVLAIDVRSRRAFTVHRGDGLVTRHPPGPESKERKALMALYKKLPSSLTPQQRKRLAEFREKLDEASKAALGERLDEMYELTGLVTRTEKRGRGYGTALVASVTAKADAEGRATWLCSSNLVNTAFYEQCGFVGVKDFTLGDDPTWTKPPVIARVMVREPGGSGN